LREVIRVLNQIFSELRLERHPDKTFIECMERGSNLPDYHFSPHGLSVAEETIEKCLARTVRCYEQAPGEAVASSRLGKYLQRWIR
jgi:RNA-directed DNA polymerase